jgi:molecular chaperone GrpE
MAEDKQAEEVKQAETGEQVDEVVTPDVDTEAQGETEEIEIDPVVALEAKLAEAEDKYLRAHAEMQNIQTRSQREQAQAIKYAASNLGKAILPAVDNLERALQVESDDPAAKQLITGVEMVLKTLTSALEDNGIKATGEVGAPFDPNFHQAIQSVPADDEHPADTIATVLQKGYVLDDRVLRPAMVAVYN